MSSPSPLRFRTSCAARRGTACYLLLATRYLLHATCYLLLATCYLLLATCDLLRPTSYVLHPTSYILHPTSHFLLSPYILHLTDYLCRSVWCIQPGGCTSLANTDAYGELLGRTPAFLKRAVVKLHFWLGVKLVRFLRQDRTGLPAAIPKVRRDE